MWCRHLGSCARGKKNYIYPGCDFYLPKAKQLTSPRDFAALVILGILARGAAYRFLGGSTVLHLLCVHRVTTLSAFQGPNALPGSSKALGHTQLVPNLNSSLFLFGLCSLQQIGYVLARQLGISAASVTFNCPHTGSNLSRGLLKAFLRLLW